MNVSFIVFATTRLIQMIIPSTSLVTNYSFESGVCELRSFLKHVLDITVAGVAVLITHHVFVTAMCVDASYFCHVRASLCAAQRDRCVLLVIKAMSSWPCCCGVEIFHCAVWIRDMPSGWSDHFHPDSSADPPVVLSDLYPLPFIIYLFKIPRPDSLLLSSYN